MKMRCLIAVSVLAAAAGCGSPTGTTAARDIRLDYAYYNPLSLVVRDQHLLEGRGYNVTWVLSAGSNKANEGLRSKGLDFGSTAGSAALVARANGTPIKIIDVYSKPEWTALVVGKNSTATSVADLKGKKIAVTKGTDPYFFLLQSLATAGLSPADVEMVNLQHADGKTALERGDVDAWSGLDPFMAQTIQQQGSRMLYRNPDFNSYGVLNVREDFSAAHPDVVQSVVNSYEEARKWAKAHPEELAALLASQAKVTPSVAQEELRRTVLDIPPAPGDPQRTVLTNILPIAVADSDIKSDDSGRGALGTIIEPKYAQHVS
ncbi:MULTISPECIES: aliphatic sulfonate ABC transporter substrate-binding protein [unclassified Mycobacterium]|uniref:aliphatic sulfonate ABC transporter substrate-binding protein n=1 Tax=unclassified Mycobacterium TaxID=2642494 RepID=UPI00080170D4|nr:MULTISPECIES: aliphatic sulfonate ABC transporter substrate-binding protein [unclassified Mycobacterium]OBG60985.1 ABC transporter substrate-binding protein [Mycobacterium sp. E735]OBG64453.1 ABC transporter substrate-binding protein [Mycobacterium sp. E188]OBG69745.1 ABC transporter substrate-binding protein [Mycobacterium sp. E3305]OBG94491.1 ABC transporter substrate-binding protein [Mycobacterium sp. E3298]OBH14522.1 ABC transporter substrate-binding protein [Mycobacterium sp. E1715]